MNIEKQCRAYSIPNTINLPLIEQPIEAELLIPEYCPDIKKILKCSVNNRIINKSVVNQILELECCSEITVLFCGEDNQLSSLITKYNFTKSIENKLFVNNHIMVEITNNNFNCRPTSYRRVDIKGSVNINISVNSFDVKDVVCDIQRSDIELLRATNETNSCIFTKEKNIIIEDELLISSSKPDINYILRQDALPIINECKLIGDKAVVKGSVKIDVLYCSADNLPVAFREIIPFSQIIELDLKNQSCDLSCDIVLSSLDIKPMLSATANNGFVVSVGLNIILSGNCNVSVDYIKDCFSTKVQTEVTKDKISFDKLIEKLNEKFVFKKVITFKESQISSVVDLWCNEEKINATLTSDTLTFTGEIACSVIYCDLENSVEYGNVGVEFEFNKKIGLLDNLALKNSRFTVLSWSYTLISDNQIEIQAEISLLADIYQHDEFACVSEVIDLEKNIENNESIIIYYSSDEEEVWEVAKRFATPIQILKNQNDITEDIISSQSVLVISRA